MRVPLATLAAIVGSTAIAAAQPARVVASIDHVAIYVTDLNSSVRFYKDVFGFQEVAAPFPIARWLRMGNGVVLHIVSGRTTAVPNSKWDHIALACASMDVMIAALNARQIAWTDIQGRHQPQVRPDGVKQIFISDPDGYWIEINDAAKTK